MERTFNVNLAFTLKSLVRIVLGVLAGLCLLLYLGQAQLVYVPTRPIEATPAQLGLPFEELRLSTSDGERLGGWFIPAATTGAPRAVLLCHGNGGNIGDRLEAIRLFHDLGQQVLIFDYRGYGASSGTPDEEGTHRDARAAWDHLVQTRGFRPDQIVIHGRSLGGAVATRLAREVRPAGVIIEASFTSLPDMAAHLYPYLPVRLLCRFRYDSRAHLPHVTCPVLVAHSPQDEMIPFAMGQQLFQAAPQPKQFVELLGGHNEGEVFFSPAYRLALQSFLNRAVAPR